MIDILECTMRDASYPISYQFTAEDTAIVVAGLYHAGFTRIEIGHGLGLGASCEKFGFAAASDEEYIAAASSVLPQKIFGVFAIPGIASLKDIDLIAKYKGGFVRIGTNVCDTNEAESFIKKSKNLGLEVSCNLMKTYSASIKDVVERSLQLQSWGADIIAVVDSAGGMMTVNVIDYVKALVSAGVNKVGFHGHNNLQLAVANSLAAIGAGATIIDGTLRGLGRSSGNAQTEALVMCMERLGHKTGIDIYKMLDISENYIAPLARGRGSDNIELVSGYSLFHSSYIPILEKVAKSQNVDIRSLILAVGDGNGNVINEETVTKVSSELKESMTNNSNELVKETITLFEKTYHSKVSKNAVENVEAILFNELSSISRKTGKTSVLTITLGEDFAKTNPFIRWSDNKLIGNIEINEKTYLKEIIKNIDGKIDFILIDECLVNNFSEFQNCKSSLIPFSESNVLVLALDAFLNVSKFVSQNTKFVINGINSTSVAFAEILIRKKYNISIYERSESKLNSMMIFFTEFLKINSLEKTVTVNAVNPDSSYDIIISFTNDISDPIVMKILNNLSKDGVAIDASKRSFSSEFIHVSREKNIQLYRLDMRAALAAEVSLRIETNNLVKNVMGKSIINGFPVLAGGVIGPKGSIIIDSITSPRNILGVADGNGNILNNDEEKEFSNNIKGVKNYILTRRMIK